MSENWRFLSSWAICASKASKTLHFIKLVPVNSPTLQLKNFIKEKNDWKINEQSDIFTRHTRTMVIFRREEFVVEIPLEIAWKLKSPSNTHQSSDWQLKFSFKEKKLIRIKIFRTSYNAKNSCSVEHLVFFKNWKSCETFCISDFIIFSPINSRKKKKLNKILLKIHQF